jgi:Uri superfamily endonuclease
MSRKFVPFNGFDSGPGEGGAYALLIRLNRALTIDIKVFSQRGLNRGHYLYLGSAHGPGGVAARVRRHLAPTKRLHWHVDWLTTAGRVVAVAVFPGGNECRLTARALALPGAEVPIRGFGSSDCRRCPAHLVALPGSADGVLEALLAAAPDGRDGAIYSTAGRVPT